MSVQPWPHVHENPVRHTVKENLPLICRLSTPETYINVLEGYDCDTCRPWTFREEYLGFADSSRELRLLPGRVLLRPDDAYENRTESHWEGSFWFYSRKERRSLPSLPLSHVLSLSPPLSFTPRPIFSSQKYRTSEPSFKFFVDPFTFVSIVHFRLFYKVFYYYFYYDCMVTVKTLSTGLSGHLYSLFLLPEKVSLIRIG